MSDVAGDRPQRSTRQLLTVRQSATVDALLEAGLASLRDEGYAAMSLRSVATRAGVTHTTAYNYFTSKDHLVAELTWRQMEALPDPAPADDATLPERVAEALRATSEMYSDEPALSEGVLLAMLGQDPETRRLRDAIGGLLAQRIQLAIGADADPVVVDGALMLYTGAMLEAGLGYSTFADVVERIRRFAETWDAGTSGR
jgi:AcrR family transcriptional regulator